MASMATIRCCKDCIYLIIFSKNIYLLTQYELVCFCAFLIVLLRILQKSISMVIVFLPAINNDTGSSDVASHVSIILVGVAIIIMSMEKSIRCKSFVKSRLYVTYIK